MSKTKSVGCGGVPMGRETTRAVEYLTGRLKEPYDGVFWETREEENMELGDWAFLERETEEIGKERERELD